MNSLAYVSLETWAKASIRECSLLKKGITGSPVMRIFNFIRYCQIYIQGDFYQFILPPAVYKSSFSSRKKNHIFVLERSLWLQSKKSVGWGLGSGRTGAQVCGELRGGQVSSSAQNLQWRTSRTCYVACSHSPLYPRAGKDGIICFSSVINHRAKLRGRPNCYSL